QFFDRPDQLSHHRLGTVSRGQGHQQALCARAGQAGRTAEGRPVAHRDPRYPEGSAVGPLTPGSSRTGCRVVPTRQADYTTSNTGIGPAARSRPSQRGAPMAEKKDRPQKIVADNRRARFNYEIGETVEAGIALTGSEVKSLRQGRATIAESYADTRGGEVWLVNANIPEYVQAGRFNHAPKRPRKLLLHRRQIDKLAGGVERDGMTIVPLRMYFNERGRGQIQPPPAPPPA